MMKQTLQILALAVLCATPASAKKIAYGPNYPLVCSSYSRVVHQGQDAIYHFHTANRARIELTDNSGPMDHPILRTQRADSSGNADIHWRVGSGARLGYHTITAYAYKSQGDIGARSQRVVLRIRVIHK